MRILKQVIKITLKVYSSERCKLAVNLTCKLSIVQKDFLKVYRFTADLLVAYNLSFLCNRVIFITRWHVFKIISPQIDFCCSPV